MPWQVGRPSLVGDDGDEYGDGNDDDDDEEEDDVDDTKACTTES